MQDLTEKGLEKSVIVVLIKNKNFTREEKNPRIVGVIFFYISYNTEQF